MIVTGLGKWFMGEARPPNSQWLPCCGRMGLEGNTAWSVASNRCVLTFQLCRFLAAGPSPAAVGPEGRIQMMVYLPDVKMFLKWINQASFSYPDRHTFIKTWECMFDFEVLGTFKLCPRRWSHKEGSARPAVCVSTCPASVPHCRVWTGSPQAQAMSCPPGKPPLVHTLGLGLWACDTCYVVTYGRLGEGPPEALEKLTAFWAGNPELIRACVEGKSMTLG